MSVGFHQTGIDIQPARIHDLRAFRVEIFADCSDFSIHCENIRKIGFLMNRVEDFAAFDQQFHETILPFVQFFRLCSGAGMRPPR